MTFSENLQLIFSKTLEKRIIFMTQESKKRLGFKQEMAHLGKEAGCGERKWAGPDEKRLDKWVKGH